jgi:hypothetical protein
MRFIRSLMFAAYALSAIAGAAVPTDQLRQDFNHRYQDYLRPESEALLPFPALDKVACQQLIASGRLRTVYSEPGKAYNAKIYTFTLYQEGAESIYYLEVKGGFWGMDQLCYGPLTNKDLR